MVRARSSRLTGAITLLGLAIVSASLTSPVRAQNVYTWANVGSDWGTAADWGGTVPTGTDIGLFNAVSYTGTQPNLAAPYAAGGVWSTGSGNVTISGSALTLNGTTINSNSSIGIEMDPGAGAMTFSNSLALGGPQTWLNNSGSLLTAGNIDTSTYTLTIAGSSNVALSGNISDAGGLTMLGSGLLQLSGSNTYTGATITNGGTLQLTGGQLVGSTLQYVGSSNTASFVQSAGTVGAASGLYLGYTGTGNGSYTLSTGSLGAPNQYVGYSGTGSFAQLGGINTASGTLDVGFNSGSNGSYALSGGSLFGRQVIGNSGSGSFSLSGGTSNASTALYLGYTATGNGSLSVSGGSLYAAGATLGTVVGYAGSGSLAVSGGTTSATLVYAGSGAGATGSLNISGGSLSSTIEYIGYYGHGSYSLSGGSNTASTDLFIGEQAGSSGTGSIGQSGFLKTATLGVGIAGTGSLTQSGGTAGATSLYVGMNAGSNGTYNLSGGSLYAATQNVGYAGTGSFTLSGGTTTGNLEVGVNSATSSGSYTLSSGSLYCPSFQYVGVSGTGSFTQSGGTNTVLNQRIGAGANGHAIYNLTGGNLTVTGSMYVGYQGNGGTFNLSNGTESVTNYMIVGNTGTGSFNCPGGILNIGNANTTSSLLYMGYTTGGSATVTQSGGAITLSPSSALFMGYGGFSTTPTKTPATYNMTGGIFTSQAPIIGLDTATGVTVAFNQSGGTVAFPDTSTPQGIVYGIAAVGNYGPATYNLSGSGVVTGDELNIGQNYYSGSLFGSGNFNQSGGLLQTAGNYSVLVNGFEGNGNYIQSGGTNASGEIINGLYGVGEAAAGSPASIGNYTLTGSGLVSIPSGGGFETGFDGVGSFTQSGGTVSTPYFELGVATTTSTGAATITGGNIVGSVAMNVGITGSGTVNQSGGLNDWSTSPFGITLGLQPGGFGAYNLSGSGVITTSALEIGASGATGIFTQTGGTVSTEFLELGTQTSIDSGTANISGGQIAGSTEMNVGIAGSGVVNQSGGVNDWSLSTGGVVLGLEAGGFGAYNLSGSGILNSSALILGFSGAGFFTQTGGTNNCLGNADLGYYPGSSGTLNLNGGLMSVAAGQGLEVGVQSTGLFAQSGGTLSTAYLELGTDAATATGTANITGGLIIGSTAMNVGISGSGVVNQSGGLNDWSASPFGVTLALDPGAFGAYNLSGSGVLNTSALEVGSNGAGVFAQSGGTLSTQYLELATQAPSATGTANITGGQIEGTVAMNVGIMGSGFVTQSGGLNDWSLSPFGVTLGLDAGGFGAYTLSGSGVLNTSALEVGSSGSGVFTQSGGTLSTQFFELGTQAPSATGTANITGGKIVGTSDMNVGISGSGVVNQSGGLNDWSASTGGIALGYGSGGFGAYNLSSSGVLNSSSLVLGLSGAGVFTQTGGTNNCLGGVVFGGYAGSSGTLNLNGGLLNLANGMGVAAGQGQFNFGGGTLAAISNIAVPMPITLTGIGTIATNGNSATFSGQISGAGGLICTDSGGGLLIISASNNYTGGTQITSGSVQIGSSSALGTGALAANGGTLDLSGFGVTVSSFSGAAGTVTNNGAMLAALTASQTGTTTFGGTIKDGAAKTALVMSGGTGTLTLTGTNTYTGGTTVSSGTLIAYNSYGLADGSNLSVGGDLSLFGTISPAGKSRSANGSDPSAGGDGSLIARLSLVARSPSADGSDLSASGDSPLSFAARSRLGEGGDLSAGVDDSIIAPFSLTARRLSAGDLSATAPLPKVGTLGAFDSLSPAASSQPAISPVPEPGTLAILGAGAAALAFYSLRRQRIALVNRLALRAYPQSQKFEKKASPPAWGGEGKERQAKQPFKHFTDTAHFPLERAGSNSCMT
jgi:fibronectin-binding autotransporter adhesin